MYIKITGKKFLMFKWLLLRKALNVSCISPVKLTGLSQYIIDSMDMSLSNLWEIVKTGKPGMLQSTWSQRVGHG